MSTAFSIVNVGRYLVLSCVGIMAVGYVVILILKLVDKKPRPMMSERSRVVFWLSAMGVPAFLLGLALAVLPQLGYGNLGVALVIGGVLALVASTFLNVALAKSKRAAWPVVAARCTEQQLQKKRFATENGSTDGWLWRVVCEMDYGGENYIVSPKVHWSDLGQSDEPFWNEEKAQQFISQKIMPKGECKLRVNPNNPLEVELL